MTKNIKKLKEMRFGSGAVSEGRFVNFYAVEQSEVKTLPEQLAEKLAEQIIRGIYAPGQRLQETVLSEQFGVSRGPVRESLRLLEREGLVSMPSRRGASVTSLSVKNLEDIFSVRCSLMALCAEELARTPSGDLQRVLDDGTALLLRANDAGDVEEFIVIVYQLSMFIAEASENEIARKILFSLGRQTLSLTRKAFRMPDIRTTWVTNWQGIVEAIRQGDRRGARRSVKQLIDDVKAAAMQVLASLEPPTEAPPRGARFL